MHAWSLDEGLLATPYFTGGIDHYHPPIYPGMIALIHRLVDSWPEAARWVAVLFSGLALLPLFFLGRRLFHVEAGLFAVSLFVAFPLLVLAGVRATPLPVLLFFVSLGILWCWRTIEEKRCIFALPAGLSLGLAYLTMTQSLLFMAALLFAYCWFAFVHHRLTLRRLSQALLLSLAGFLLFAGSYEWYNYSKNGSFNLRPRLEFFQSLHENRDGSGAWSCSAGTLNRDADALYNLELARTNSPLAYIYEHPREYREWLLDTLPALYDDGENSYQAVPTALWILIALAALGMIIHRKEKTFFFSRHLFLSLWFFLPLAGSWLFYGVLPCTAILVGIPLLLWAGCGMRAFRLTVGSFADQRVKGFFLTHQGIWAWLLLLLILFPKGEVLALYSRHDSGAEADQKEQAWFHEKTGGAPRKIVLSPEPGLALKTGNFWYLLPRDCVNRVSLYARSQDVDFIVGHHDEGFPLPEPIDHLDQLATPFDKAGLRFLDEKEFGSGETAERRILYAVKTEKSTPLSEGEKPPNLILISIDTLRADHLACYGYDRTTSPVMDRLADQGVRFEKVISHAPKTAASHMTIFTSTWLDVHGVCQVKNQPKFTLLPKELTTMTEVMSEAGYRTGAFTGGSQVAGGFGFERGFEVYDPSLGYQLFPESFHPIYQWLSTLDPEESFFLFFHTYQVHGPYCPPPPYDTLYDPHYNGWIKSDWDGRKKQLAGDKGRSNSPRDIRHLRALYDGEIRYTDNLLGKFFDTLRNKGLLGMDETLLVILSDHGEEFDEHNGMGHNNLNCETMEVPLIFYWPGVLPEKTVVPGMVRLIDVAPTVLDLLGLSVPAQMQGLSMKAPMLSGQRVCLSAYSTDPVNAGQAAIRSGQWMYYTKNKEGKELYSVEMDPREKNNFFGFSGLKNGFSEDSRILDGRIQGFQSHGRKFKHIFHIKRPELFDRKEELKAYELTDEQKARLKELGYL